MPNLSPATLSGLLAIGLWSTLALLTASTGAVPPFLLASLTFAIAGGVGLIFVLTRPGGLAVLAQPWWAWLHGVGGLFGFHACYFSALKFAPPAEAGLMSYLWPLLIVLFAALLPGGRLLPRQVLGALSGLAGTAVLLGRGFDLSAAYLPGYAAALGAALIWAIYSVASRLFAAVPTEAVAGFCLATAVLSVPFHLALEPTVWPAGAGEWLAVIGLGLGPVGLAFFAWDRGMKRGDVQLLGVAAYAAPVLSTALLVLAGRADASWRLALACALIVGGALLASFRGR
jgi:drug/metabolite transporter (DMT)-like permease